MDLRRKTFSWRVVSVVGVHVEGCGMGRIKGWEIDLVISPLSAQDPKQVMASKDQQRVIRSEDVLAQKVSINPI